jgi:tetratricopeptide (TPR) repeat protein
MAPFAWAIALAAALLSSPAAAARDSAAQQEARDYFTKATAAFGLGHYEEAAHFYESAFSVHPDASLLYDAAQANRLAGARARALQLYRNYLRLYPTGAFAPQVKKQIAELEKPAGDGAAGARRSDAAGAGAQQPAAAEPAAPAAAAPGRPPASAARAAAPPPAAVPTRPPQALPAVRVSPISAGAEACAATTAQLDLDEPIAGVEIAHGLGHAFDSPAFDASRAWCGTGSLRVQAHFSLKEGRTTSGVIPTQLGEVYLKLPARIDLTGRTVTAHVYVDAPAGVVFGGQLLAANGKVWVDGAGVNNQPTGRWITLSHTFAADNRLYMGGTAKVDQTDGIVVQLWALGAKSQRTWDGAVYIDDVAWK